MKIADGKVLWYQLRIASWRRLPEHAGLKQQQMSISHDSWFAWGCSCGCIQQGLEDRWASPSPHDLHVPQRLSTGFSRPRRAQREPPWVSAGPRRQGQKSQSSICSAHWEVRFPGGPCYADPPQLPNKQGEREINSNWTTLENEIGKSNKEITKWKNHHKTRQKGWSPVLYLLWMLTKVRTNQEVLSNIQAQIMST